MKIAAYIKGCYQVGVDLWQDYAKTYIFDDTVTIAQILKTTKQKDICDCNLSMVVEDQSKPVLKFKVIDKLTGKEADIKAIAETEEWAMLLMHIEMVVFDSCSKALADKREEFWIRRALHFNHRLTNRTHGNLILSLWGADHFLFGQFFPVQEVPVEKLLEFWIRSWDEYRATEKSTNAWGLEVLATEQGAIDQLNDMVRKLPGRYPLFNRREVKV